MAMQRLLNALALGLVFCGAAVVGADSAPAAELRLVSSLGLKPVVDALVPEFERTTGQEVHVRFALTPEIPQVAVQGDGFDVAISDPRHIAQMISQGTAKTGSATDVARFGLGVGVRAGATKPDVGSPATLKRAVLGFNSIGYVAVGSTGPVVMAMLAKLGVADNVKPRLKSAGVAESLSAVAEGATEAVLMPVPLIRAAKGVELAGPWPNELQDYVVMTAGVSSATRQSKEADALVTFFMSPAATAVVNAKGYERTH